VGFLQIWKRLELSRERCDLRTGKKKKTREIEVLKRKERAF
jgi:hypothetical protein